MTICKKKNIPLSEPTLHYFLVLSLLFRRCQCYIHNSAWRYLLQASGI